MKRQSTIALLCLAVVCCTTRSDAQLSDLSRKAFKDIVQPVQDLAKRLTNRQNPQALSSSSSSTGTRTKTPFSSSSLSSTGTNGLFVNRAVSSSYSVSSTALASTALSSTASETSVLSSTSSNQNKLSSSSSTGSDDATTSNSTFSVLSKHAPNYKNKHYNKTHPLPNFKSIRNFNITQIRQQYDTIGHQKYLSKNTRESALFFDLCEDSVPDNMMASVNWMTNEQNKNTSILEYTICQGPSLQPRLIQSLLLINQPNKYGSKPFVAMSFLCGPNSLSEKPCNTRDPSIQICNQGTSILPAPFDPIATNAIIQLNAVAPATSIVTLCL